MIPGPQRDSWVSEAEHQAVSEFRKLAQLHDSSADWDLILFAFGSGQDREGAEAVRHAHRAAGGTLKLVEPVSKKGLTERQTDGILTDEKPRRGWD